MKRKVSSEETRLSLSNMHNYNPQHWPGKMPVVNDFHIQGREKISYQIGDFSRVWKRFWHLPTSTAPTGYQKKCPTNMLLTQCVDNSNFRKGARHLDLSLYIVWTTLRKTVQTLQKSNEEWSVLDAISNSQENRTSAPVSTHEIEKPSIQGRRS